MQKKGIFRQKVKRLAQIDRDFLRKNFIQGVLLDLDNTIVSEDDVYLSPEAESWIHSAQKEGIKFFILSNGKRIYRVNYWSSRLKIPAISPAKKPFIFSFRKALKALQLESSQVIVVGDSFHTDILGAIFLGCSSIQVASLPHPPRWWEKILGRWLQDAYRDVHELWLFDSNYS
jgi:uncharacterized protein